MTVPRAGADVSTGDADKTDRAGTTLGDQALRLAYGHRDAADDKATLAKGPEDSIRASTISGNIASGLRIKEPDTGMDRTYTVKNDMLTVKQTAGTDESQITFDRSGKPSKYIKNDVPISKENWPAEVSSLTAKLEVGKVFDQKTKTFIDSGIGAVTVAGPDFSRSLYLNEAGEISQKRDLDLAKNVGFDSTFERKSRDSKDLRESERLLIDPQRNRHEQETDTFGLDGKVERKDVAINTKDGLSSTQSYEKSYDRNGKFELTEQKFNTDSGYQSTLGLQIFGTTMRTTDAKTGIEQHVTRYDEGGFSDEFQDRKTGVDMSLNSAWDKNVKGSSFHLGGPNFDYYRDIDAQGKVETKLFVDRKEVKPEEQANKLKELTGFASTPAEDGGERQTFKVAGNNFTFDFDKSGGLTHHEITTADGLTSNLTRSDQDIKLQQRYRDNHREQAFTLGADRTGSSNLREWPDKDSLVSADFFRDSKDKAPMLLLKTFNDAYDSRSQ